MRRCLAYSSYANVMHWAFVTTCVRSCFVMTLAPSSKLCANASYHHFGTLAQVIWVLTDSMRWTGVCSWRCSIQISQLKVVMCSLPNILIAVTHTVNNHHIFEPVKRIWEVTQTSRGQGIICGQFICVEQINMGCQMLSAPDQGIRSMDEWMEFIHHKAVLMQSYHCLLMSKFLIWITDASMTVQVTHQRIRVCVNFVVCHHPKSAGPDKYKVRKQTFCVLPLQKLLSSKSKPPNYFGIQSCHQTLSAM